MRIGILLLTVYGLRILQAIACGCLDFDATLLYGLDWLALYALQAWHFDPRTRAVVAQMHRELL